jgi:hypothetical protein
MPSVSLATVLALAGENGRICPKPPKWAKLYDMLPNTRRQGYGRIPPAPLILVAWWETGDEQKAGRLREHFDWAEKYAVLDGVYEFLVSLPESEWHHAGE